jgi:hypothetical protein
VRLSRLGQPWKASRLSRSNEAVNFAAFFGDLESAHDGLGPVFRLPARTVPICTFELRIDPQELVYVHGAKV